MFWGQDISLLWLHFSCILDFHLVAVNLTGPVFAAAQFSCSYQCFYFVLTNLKPLLPVHDFLRCIFTPSL